MKTVVSVSLGSSEHDYDVQTHFLGQSFRVIRTGTDANQQRAEQILRALEVDAIGLSMVHDHYQVGRERLKNAQTAQLQACVPNTSVTTGVGLRGILQEWAVRRTQASLGHFFDNARVLCLNGKASYRIARALSEHTENFQFADPYLEYGVPGFLTSLAQLERYVALTAPLAKTPSAVKIVEALLGNPLYRMGKNAYKGACSRR